MAVKVGGKGSMQQYDPRTGKWIKEGAKERPLPLIQKMKMKLQALGLEETKINEFLTWFQAETKQQAQPSEEQENFNILDKETLSKLRATPEGRKIVINAPTMARKDLESAVKKVLGQE